MEIIGRKIEKEILEGLKHEKTSQFLAVYGRRRVGKTYLIRNYYKNEILFECAGLNDAPLKSQLENFKINLQPLTKIPLTPFQSWLEAFDALANIIKKRKKKRTNNKLVLFFDEISWFDTPRSNFKSALSNFWNNFCTKQSNIILVICGSASSWILKHIINDKGGLHNRLNRVIQLNAFSLGETRTYLQNRKIKLSNYDYIRIYMCI
ncbi:MAG: ATP-binding protein, partial [Bacteroidota bacterium]